MALSILTVGIFASLGHFGTLNGLRRQSADLNTVHTIVSALAERFQGCRWESIGVTTVPWSLPRLEPGPVAATAVANDPLMDDVNLSSTERSTRGLQTLGLAPTPSGLESLRIYVEFYRSLTVRNETGVADTTQPGIMDKEPGGVAYTDVADFQTRYQFESRWENLGSLTTKGTVQAAVKAKRNTYRLSTTSAPTAQVGQNDPITIRILATWGDRGQFAVFTSRKR